MTEHTHDLQGGPVQHDHILTVHDTATSAGPHDFHPVGRWWHWWICRHCYAPKALHPRTAWVRARPIGDNTYLSADAPHFKEGW